MAGEIIRHATGSWAGHAFLYVGNGLIVQGQPPEAGTAVAASHDDAIWAWRMWDQLKRDRDACSLPPAKWRPGLTAPSW